jgi:hypothetical protein
MARNFDEEQASAIGITKCYLITTAPKEIQKELTEFAVKGASRSDITEKIKQIKHKAYEQELDNDSSSFVPSDDDNDDVYKESKITPSESKTKTSSSSNNMVNFKCPEDDYHLAWKLASTGQDLDIPLKDVKDNDSVYVEFSFVGGKNLTITQNMERTGLILSFSSAD